jgi:hypothetical protein
MIFSQFANEIRRVGGPDRQAPPHPDGLCSGKLVGHMSIVRMEHPDPDYYAWKKAFDSDPAHPGRPVRRAA